MPIININECCAISKTYFPFAQCVGCGKPQNVKDNNVQPKQAEQVVQSRHDTGLSDCPREDKVGKSKGETNI